MKKISMTLKLCLLSTILTLAQPSWAGPNAIDLKRVSEKVEFLMRAAKIDSKAVYSQKYETPLNGDLIGDLLVKMAISDIRAEYTLDEFISEIKRIEANYNMKELDESKRKGLTSALIREIESRLNKKAFLFKNIAPDQSLYSQQKRTEAKKLIDFLFDVVGIPADLKVQATDVNLINGIKLKTLILEAYLNGHVNAVNLVSRVRTSMSSSTPAKKFFWEADSKSILDSIIGYYKDISSIASSDFSRKFREQDSKSWSSEISQVELTTHDLHIDTSKG